MSIACLSQESTHCQLSSCGFEPPACGEQESNYSTAPFSQLSFMETVLSGSSKIFTDKAMACCSRSETGNFSNTSEEPQKVEYWKAGKSKNYFKVQKSLA